MNSVAADHPPTIQFLDTGETCAVCGNPVGDTGTVFPDGTVTCVAPCSLGGTVRYWRLVRRISIRQLAAQIQQAGWKVSHGYLAKIERDSAVRPSIDVLDGIATLLEIPRHNLYRAAGWPVDPVAVVPPFEQVLAARPELSGRSRLILAGMYRTLLKDQNGRNGDG